ncbi:MAG: L-2-amino-thiazoline-4-carboxylic acid hydrolase [Mucilaginibacter sp.]|uniref:L-2-amino-thiazoline-4-carboxylic acid hydrolase n=1 Tax=Mucilaginibacter sp. TaxID=1882438 RepID=UPI0032644F6D
MKNLLLYWFKIQAAKSAKIELIKLYDIETVKQILSSYWQRYQKLKPDVPVMPTLGGYVTVHLAALSTAFYHELTTRGQNEEATAKIFYDIAWKVYIKMGKLSWWLAGWRNRNNYGRLLKTTQLFRAFPFNSPSYKWQDIKIADNVVGFDCLKCPVAEYFQSKRLSKFCTQTWCSLDYPLAQLWHAKLKRTGSIAGGADKCDFRWTAEDPPRSETLTPNIH